MPYLNTRFLIQSNKFLKACPLLLALTMSGRLIGQTLVSAPPAQNFGAGAVNAASPVSLTFSYNYSGTPAPGFSLKYGRDFNTLSLACSGSGTVTCQATVKFQPRSPGLRQDAILVTDKIGNLLATTLLYGIGTAPQMSIYPGVISTVAGRNTWGYAGDGGWATAAALANPLGLAVDTLGNLYISDSLNQVIRMVTASTGVISTVAGNTLGGYRGDGGPAIRASLNNPAGLALDGAGNLFVADAGNNVVRKIDAKTQIITTVAGGGGAFGLDGFGDGGPATSALLSGPIDVAVDGAGNLYIADSYHGLVRKVDAATGIISVVAGGGTSAGNDGLGDGGPAVKAFLDNLTAIALDGAGNLYIADAGHALIRKVDATGLISVVAGNGRSGFTGDGGLATNAALGTPAGLRVDAAGNLYIADERANVIRKVSAANGVISTLAGTGAQKYAGDGGAPAQAALANPTAVALDWTGNLYIADYTNNVVRKVLLNSNAALVFPSTVAGQVSNPAPVTVLNTGNQPLAISGLRLSPGYRQWISGAADCSAASILAPGGACNINVQFAPTTAGTIPGSLAVTQNSLNTTGALQVAVFTGASSVAAALPQISFSPASLTFPIQPVGTPSAVQTITVSNGGGAPLSISSLQLAGANGADFGVTTTCQSVLAAGAKCSVFVTFTPASLGTRTAALSVTDFLASSPQSVSLTGTAGQPAAALSTAAVSFGKQPIGKASSPQSITLTNSGSAPLNVNSTSISGSNAGDFSFTSTCGSGLNAGSKCSLSIAFLPHAMGNRSATLTVSDNAAGSTQTITLSGLGAMPAQPAVWRPSNGHLVLLPRQQCHTCRHSVGAHGRCSGSGRL